MGLLRYIAGAAVLAGLAIGGAELGNHLTSGVYRQGDITVVVDNDWPFGRIEYRHRKDVASMLTFEDYFSEDSARFMDTDLDDEVESVVLCDEYRCRIALPGLPGTPQYERFQEVQKEWEEQKEEMGIYELLPDEHPPEEFSL